MAMPETAMQQMNMIVKNTFIEVDDAGYPLAPVCGNAVFGGRGRNHSTPPAFNKEPQMAQFAHFQGGCGSPSNGFALVGSPMASTAAYSPSSCWSGGHADASPGPMSPGSCYGSPSYVAARTAMQPWAAGSGVPSPTWDAAGAQAPDAQWQRRAPCEQPGGRPAQWEVQSGRPVPWAAQGGPVPRGMPPSMQDRWSCQVDEDEEEFTGGFFGAARDEHIRFEPFAAAMASEQPEEVEGANFPDSAAAHEEPSPSRRRKKTPKAEAPSRTIDEAKLSLVPLDADGRRTSIGSIAHAEKQCRPCAFARSSAGCKFGMLCNFCHIVAEHPEAVRARPCKGKRERFKRTIALIEERVANDPDFFSGGGLTLPAFVDCNPRARARVMAQLAQVAADSYRNRGGTEATQAGDSEQHESMASGAM